MKVSDEFKLRLNTQKVHKQEFVNRTRNKLLEITKFEETLFRINNSRKELLFMLCKKIFTDETMNHMAKLFFINIEIPRRLNKKFVREQISWLIGG